jgi:hypothetical protein
MADVEIEKTDFVVYSVARFCHAFRTKSTYYITFKKHNSIDGWVHLIHSRFDEEQNVWILALSYAGTKGDNTYVKENDKDNVILLPSTTTQEKADERITNYITDVLHQVSSFRERLCISVNTRMLIWTHVMTDKNPVFAASYRLTKIKDEKEHIKAMMQSCFDEYDDRLAVTYVSL